MVRLGNRLLFLFSIFVFLTSYLSSEECWIINKVFLHSSQQLLPVWKRKILSKSLIYNIVSPSVLLLLPGPFHHLPSPSTPKGDSLVLVTTGLGSSALVSAGLQGCSTPGACSLQCSSVPQGKTLSPWHRQAASSHPWAKSTALSRDRRTGKVGTELPFLQTGWGCRQVP